VRRHELKRRFQEEIVIHPRNYHVNQTWLIFKLNEMPIQTEADGDFNCFVLMDAASSYIVSSMMISVSEVEPSLMESKRMFKQGKAQKNALPQELLVPDELCAKELAAEAQRQGIKVVRLPEAQLHAYTEEAREVFRAQFGGFESNEA
jgi:hypothetical protein